MYHHREGPCDFTVENTRHEYRAVRIFGTGTRQPGDKETEMNGAC